MNPLATLALCALGAAAPPPSRALPAVAMVMVGVTLTVWANAEFDSLGFAAGLASTWCQAMVGVSVRKAILHASVSGAAAHWLMCVLISAGVGATTVVAAAVRAVAAVLHSADSGGAVPDKDGGWEAYVRSLAKLSLEELSVRVRPPRFGPGTPRPGVLRKEVLRVATALAFYLEYSFMFSFSALVDAVTLSVCDTVRRGAIVVVGRIMFGGRPLRAINILGICTALGGAVAYTRLAAGAPPARPPG